MPPASLPPIDIPSLESRIVCFIKKEVGGKGVVLGLSGGVDSSVVAALSAKAVGKDMVLALIMPEEGSTPPGDTKDATEYAESLGIRTVVIDLTPIHQCFMKAVPRFGDRVAVGNVKARLRMALLYYFANCDGRLVVGSGDRSELALGYFTKYGDGGVDILPIGALFKSQVRRMAEYLGVPAKILRKKSSPGLWAGQEAEEELGLGYEEIDLILHLHLDKGYDRARLVRELGKGWEGRIDNVLGRIEANSHKLRMPPIPSINWG